MSGSKEAILLSKLGKKKPVDTVDVIRGENDLDTMEQVPTQKVDSINTLGSSKDLLRANKLLSPMKKPPMTAVAELPEEGSSMTEKPKTKPYSPIKNYLKKGN